MNFLLYSNITKTTGRELANRLGIKSGSEAPGVPIDILIRWGSSVGVGKAPRIRTINRKEAVALAADKFASLETMRKAGVVVPKVLRLNELAHNTIAEVLKKGLKLPVLARTAHHTRGRDILLCLQNRDLRRAIRWGKQFLVEYIPTDREYRVHVFGESIIRTSQKVLMSKDEYLPYMRNDDHNHTFRNPRQNLTNAQNTVAINAVRALGLDFGAVDLIISDDGNAYVLEVNTGPSLIDNGLDIYEEKFKEAMEI